MSKLTDGIASFFGSLRRGGAPRDPHAQLDKRLVLQVSGKRMPSMSQLKHLPRFLSGPELKVVRTLAAILVVALGAMGAKYAYAHLVNVPAAGGDYVEAVVGGPKLVNPVLSVANDVDRDLVTLIYSGLLRTAEDGSLVADLAESYEIAEDGRTYTFKLKSGVTWHDRTAFSSHDVAATIGYLKNPAWKSPYAARFKNVEVETPDDLTVVFKLTEPFAPFLSMLTIGILPQHLWQDIMPENAARADRNLKPIGTGPFLFKSFTKDKNGAILAYTLARNDAYYGEKPLLATVTFRNYPDFASAQAALSERKVDGISYLPLDLRERTQRQRDIRFYTLRLPQYTAVFFNQKKNSALAAKDVRQALAMALDRPALLRESLGADAVAVHGPILAGFIGFHPEVKKYPFDLTAAGALLDKEGWKLDEADGIRKKGIVNAEKETVQTPLKIVLTTADAGENVAVAQAIQAAWKKLGVVTELDVVPTSRVQKDAVRPRNYEALLFGEILGADPDPYPFWHSSQAQTGLNLAMFSDRRADELLEKGRTATKTEDRETYYREFQDILAEQVPAIFLYSPTYTYAMNRRVKGVEAGTIYEPSDRFDGIAKWYVETKWEWR